MNAGRDGDAGPGRDRDVRTAEQLSELLDAPHPGDELPESLVTDAELKQLLSLASSLREVPARRPDSAFRTALRERLVTEASREATPVAAPRPTLFEQLRDRVDLLRRSVSLAAASAACALLIGAVGVVAAAQHAQPDDVLYGMKQVTETMRVGFAGDEVQAGRLHLQFAERRLGEVVDGARDLPSSTLIDTLGEMDRHTELGSDLLLDAYHLRDDTAVLSDLIVFVERQRGGLNGVIDTLPVETVPFAHRSLELLDRIEHEASQILFQGCVPCGEGAAGPVGSDTDAARCCPDDAADLRDDGSATDDDLTTGTEIGEEDDVPTPGSRLRGIIPVDEDVELTDDLQETVEETTDGLEDTVDDLLDDPADTVDDLVDELDDTLDDTEDDLADLLGGD